MTFYRVMQYSDYDEKDGQYQRKLDLSVVIILL